MQNRSPAAGKFGRVVAGLWLMLSVEASTTDRIDWNGERQEMRASVENSPLSKVLESIAGATGWQIYVAPDTRATVSTRFQYLQSNEALRRLLGDLNFALLRQTNGPATLFVYKTSIEDATLLVKAAVKTAKVDHLIPNELIVTLKPGAKESIEELAKRLGAKVVGRIDDLHAYRLQFDSADAAQDARSRLSGNDDVSSTDNNYSIDRPGQLESLGASQIPALNLNPNVAPNSQQLVVALVDTPVYGQGTPAKDFLLPGISLAGETPATPTELTHGTAMAETILEAIAANSQGTASKDVRILPVDIFGNNPNTTTFDIANGVDVAASKGSTIINLSLGGDSDSEFLHRTISALQQRGFVFVASAGNTPTTDPEYPAAWQEVLSVGAGTSSGGIAPYSNRSDTVDMIAPGTSIVYFGGQAYLVTGTSPAAAYATGTFLAFMRSHPKATPGEALAAIQKGSPFPSATRR